MDKRDMAAITALRHELHSHPELSMNEAWTKARLMRFIEENTGLCVIDRGNWFYAVYRANGAKKRVAFRADMDAVPVDETIPLEYGSSTKNVAHKCGHDGHCASLAGLALKLDKNGCKNDAYLIFQHAEEIGAGGAECAKLIDEEHIDEVYAYHNYPAHKKNCVFVTDGVTNFASKGMTISLTGARAHASLPETGRNPAYAVAHIVSALPGLTAVGRFTGLAICTVIQMDVGEHAFGTAAGEGKLLLTIRAQFEEEMDILERDIISIAKREASEYSLALDVKFEDAFPETRNDPACAERVRDACGKSWVQYQTMAEPMRASEDFGYYLKKTKGAIFYIGDGEEYPELHTPLFDFPDDIMDTAVEVFFALADG